MKALNPQAIVNELTVFLQTSFQKAGFENAVIAMSGGVDSSVSASLVVKALGKGHVYPLLLPYRNLNSLATQDAQLVIRHLEIPKEHVTQINIEPLVDQVVAIDPSIGKFRRGNIMARVRMMMIFDQAKKRNALVIGTENKTEHLLGYFTRFGDEASDMEPLRNLFKTQVYELAKYFRLPEQIITKSPTAGLWDGQTDEGEFGFSYKEADSILSFIVDEKKSIEEIIRQGLDGAVVKKVVQRMNDNDFKHHLPILP